MDMEFKVKDVIDAITAEASLSFQESYDNSGLLIGDSEMKVSKVLITVDITKEVIQEAINKRCEMIVSHHPLIFHGLKRLSPSNPIAAMAMDAIKNNIAVAAMHTNLDNYGKGISYKLSEKLQLTDLKVLSPMKNNLLKLVVFCPVSHVDIVRKAMMEAGAGCIGNYDFCTFNASGKGTFRANEGANPFVGEKNMIHFEDEIRIETVLPMHKLSSVVQAMLQNHPYEEVAYDVYRIENDYSCAGAGMMGVLKEEMDEEKFMKHIQNQLNIPCLCHSALLGKKIKKVAVCGGSGAFLIHEAMKKGADVYVTSDIKYHDYFEADGKILLINAGHFETEQFAKEIMADIIRKKIPNFAVLISEVKTNAVHYFVNK